MLSHDGLIMNSIAYNKTSDDSFRSSSAVDSSWWLSALLLLLIVLRTSFPVAFPFLVLLFPFRLTPLLPSILPHSSTFWFPSIIQNLREFRESLYKRMLFPKSWFKSTITSPQKSRNPNPLIQEIRNRKYRDPNKSHYESSIRD